MTIETKAVVESNATPDGFFEKVVHVAKVGYNTFTEEYSKELVKRPGGQSVIDFANKTTETVSDAYRGITEASSKIIDNVSGTESQVRIAALVEQQRRYNDILATRLAEALDRIEKLENEVGSLFRER